MERDRWRSRRDRALSESTISTGVFADRPPSPRNRPSISVTGKSGMNPALASRWSIVIRSRVLSKTTSSPVATSTVITERRMAPPLTRSKSMSLGERSSKRPEIVEAGNPRSQEVDGEALGERRHEHARPAHETRLEGGQEMHGPRRNVPRPARQRSARPVLAKPPHPLPGRVAGDDRRRDRADGRARDPDGRFAGTVERLERAGTVGAQRIAAAENEGERTGGFPFDAPIHRFARLLPWPVPANAVRPRSFSPGSCIFSSPAREPAVSRGRCRSRISESGTGGGTGPGRARSCA